MITLLARLALGVAVLCAVVVAVSGPGYRFGWWPLPVAFGMLRWGGWVAIGCAVIAAIIAVLTRPGQNRRGFPQALIAMAIGIVTMIGPLTLMSRGKQVPPIHDITTDTANPPPFVAILPLRAGVPNTATYGGAAIAEQQKKAYPEIVTLEVPAAADKTFAKALQIARDRGWTIVAADPAEGRIEATATTPFFGFKDDVVIRVAANGERSRVDMRSLSRIGRSDLGANARRVKDFLERLATAG
jgi:uncharacterized protein (DUF1499 family)